jgi:hypothetical protein
MGPRFVEFDYGGGYIRLEDSDCFFRYGESPAPKKKCFTCGMPIWSELMLPPKSSKIDSKCILCWHSNKRDRLLAFAETLAEHCCKLSQVSHPLYRWSNFLKRCATEPTGDVLWDVEQELANRIINLITTQDVANLGFVLTKMLRNKIKKQNHAEITNNTTERAVLNFYLLVVRELNANYSRLRHEQDSAESRACQSA